MASLVASGKLIARGNGRSYGDSAHQPELTLDMRGFNRMISFDEDTGLLVAEAGVLLADIIDTFLPRGWFPWVTPGTKFVTLGGMVASDVHGKNHHKDGSFGSFVAWLDVMTPDGQVQRCSPHFNGEMFNLTLGGMGLSGIIVRVATRLRPVGSGWIHQTLIPAPDLETAMAVFEANTNATYSVAWIDCLSRGRALGRSIIMLGEHAKAESLPKRRRATPFAIPERRKKTIPFDMPHELLNRFTVRAFNTAYYHRNTWRTGPQLVDWDSYFYPLDAMNNWNRIYGRSGLVQFQCVLPLDRAEAGLKALLDVVTRSGEASFLTVLKRMGPASTGAISFPFEGYTLAMDFRVSAKVFALLNKLDAITLEHGGRFYLAKDARMTAATLSAADPRTQSFTEARERLGLTRFKSSQAERLKL